MNPGFCKFSNESMVGATCLKDTFPCATSCDLSGVRTQKIPSG